MIAKKSLERMGRKAELSGTFLVTTVLGIALTESAAIYGLIIALQIIGMDQSIATLGMTI
jgi:F0F1-type ATP synthase membrane subunit c/vacuolar-type H+-ATPase subunit K